MTHIPVRAFRRIRELELVLSKIQELAESTKEHGEEDVCIYIILPLLGKVLRDSRYNLFECYKCNNLFASKNMSVKEGRVLCDTCFFL